MKHRSKKKYKSKYVKKLLRDYKKYGNNQENDDIKSYYNTL